MSGHSHFATIKRQKGLKDAAKSNIFAKLSKMITIAIKSGGGADPDMNFKLRVAIDKARENNMPKDNIERILKNASLKSDHIEEIIYEGFGPYGINVVVETATDNRNRTAQEMKNLFEKGGGNMGGPNSVLYNFVDKGYLLIQKEENVNQQSMDLIDLGAEDIEILEEGIEVFISTDKLSNLKKEAEAKGYKVLSVSLTKIAKNYIKIEEEDKLEKINKFLQNFEDHDDCQQVYTNV